MHQFGPLVSGDWLAEHAEQVRIVDTRWYLDGRSGEAAYREAHLPGAVWVDVDTDLSAPATIHDGRHPLPTPEHFAAALGRVGIGDGTPVVAYDDAGGSIAARLWWMLHVLGEPVAVLDGGISAWPGPLTDEIPDVRRVERTSRAWPVARIASADDVHASAGVVVDARTAQRFAAGDPSIDPRPGHIPGARSRPWAGNLDAETGRFLAPQQLRERYAFADDTQLIAYCGSGVTSCHVLLALEVAGMAGEIDGILYPGSWSQWGADPARPTETGHEKLTEP